MKNGFRYDESPIREPDQEEVEPECIFCGSKKCNYFYFKNGEPIGCDDCIRREEVW